MVCCFGFGGGGGGGGCAAKRSVTSTDVQAFACFMCAATPLTCASHSRHRRDLKKDAGFRTRGENVHCLISCAYSMGALGMPMVFGFREEAVGERWTLVGLLGGGV